MRATVDPKVFADAVAWLNKQRRPTSVKGEQRRLGAGGNAVLAGIHVVAERERLVLPPGPCGVGLLRPARRGPVGAVRLLCTGARVWREHQAVWRDLEKVRHLARTRGQKLTLVHGDAAGADRHVRAWCERTPEVVEKKYPVSPTMWRINGPCAGHLRNAHMVSLGADGCIAYCVPCDKPGPCRGLGGVLLPDGHATHGTYGCMELARAAGIEVWERLAA